VVDKWKVTRVSNLFTLEKCIEDEASIGEHVEWQRVRLLYTARIRLIGLAHLRTADIVIRAIWCAIRVFGPEVRRRREGQVVVNYSMRGTPSARVQREGRN
jgi:hypothetical protein